MVLAGSVCLVVAVVQFFVAMVVEQALTPGYSDFGNTISDLGIEHYSWIFNTSVILLGVLAFIGLVLLIRAFPARPLAYIGEFFLLVGVIGAIGVGLFNENSTAMGGNAHDFFSIVTFLDANLGLLMIGTGMYRDQTWGKYAFVSALWGAITTVLLAFYVYFILTNGSFFGLGEGGLERLVCFPVMIWAMLVGLAILMKWIPAESGD
jgi:hypothetical membrane protein